jgi:hypothetical protein
VKLCWHTSPIEFAVTIVIFHNACSLARRPLR